MSAYSGPADWWTQNIDIGRTHIATKGIVQTGLVLNLDASVSSSYAGTGTTWTNLTGSGNSGTLANGVGYNSANGGYLTFDGVDDRMTSTFSTTAGQAVTYTGWMYSTATASTYRNFVDSQSTSPMIWWNTAGQIEFDAALYTTSVVYRNQWVYVALSKPVGSSAASYYVNGVLVGTGSAYTTPAAIPTWFNRSAGQTWQGSCSNIQVYNRALSAAEIQRNFNARRRRFNV